ncbi:MAG: phosphatidylserine decarboxylase [Silvanigrellales bacterium]|jgi:phosphatidylserine decarboxylase|nr:phosphatidylserine decarboxylase [Silvanigrellales bacterium]
MFESILGMKSKRIEVATRGSGAAPGSTFTETVYGDDAMRVFYGTPTGLAFTSKVLTAKWLSNLYGAYNDSGASKHKIEEFVSMLGIDIAECEKDISEYASFNDFFARKLKPEMRPLAKAPQAIASPGDGRLLVFPKLDETTLAYVKWAPLKLSELFNKNQSLVERFRDGACAVLRLCPADYHRFHFPVAGKVGITKTVPGLLHSVSPYALEQKIPVYCMNKRTLCEIESDEFGKVLMMEVGALFVGSIVQTYRAGMHVQKGDEKGYFKFGGSTSILFFEKGAMRFDDDLVANASKGLETYVKMGEHIGTLASAP